MVDTDSSFNIVIDENIPPENDNKPSKDENNPQKNENKPPKKPQDIRKMEISPNGKYLVAYSEKNQTFFGWCVEDQKDKDISVDDKYDTYDKHEPEKDRIFHMYVSDEKILAYINNNEYEISK